MSPSEAIEEAREALKVFLNCAYPVDTSIDPRGYSWSEAWLDEARPIASRALAALNEVASAQIAGEGWRDISTARDTLPDTRSRLIYVPGTQCAYCATWGERGWQIFGGDYREILQHATHWQPLPAPPARAETDTLANQETTP